MSRKMISRLLVLVVVSMLVHCSADDSDDSSDDSGATADDTGDDTGADDTGDDAVFDDDTELYSGTAIIPGPGEDGYDAELEEIADRHDRQHLLFNCAGNGVNADVVIAPDHAEDRQSVESFLQETDGWDFEAYSGKTPMDVITDHQKVAGLYAGVGIAADAFRYGVLRDQDYPAEDVERAREFLIRDIEGLIIAVEITGTPGVIARGFIRTDIPGWGQLIETVPLFAEDGNPLPAEKNNGTWRDDNSEDGRFPNYIWEDSCSRDQFIGWAAAFGAVWEVIRDDPEFDETTKSKLQQYAGEIGRSLMVERRGGPMSFGQAFDLEIFDADGRTTYHGYLNENAWDRYYFAWIPIKDGMYSIMSLGIVSALTFCSEDPALEDYLYNTLISQRGLDRIASQNQLGVNLGWITNFSGTNMAMMGALLAGRYVNDSEARDRVRYATINHLYLETDVLKRQPEEYAYSLYDFVYSAAVSGASAYNTMQRAPDFTAIDRGVKTLVDYKEAPYWNVGITNCDEEEIASHVCTLEDGTVVTVLGYVGRNDDLICKEPIPHAVRPPSNYHWRSNPYIPNGDGDGSSLLPGVDFRFAYWYGRFVH